MDDGHPVPIDVLDEMILMARSELLPTNSLPLIELTRTRFSADGKGVAWDLAYPAAAKTMTVQVRAEDIYAMASDDVRAMAAAETSEDSDVREGVHPLNVICYASAKACRGGADEPWRPHQFGNAWPPGEAAMDVQLDRYRWLDSDDEINRNLENGRDVLVCGNTGSGKTTAATRRASDWIRAERGLVWLDLTDPLDTDESVLFTLLSMPKTAAVLVVVDNIQANISAARGVFDLVLELRKRLGLQLKVLATGSHSAARQEPPLSSTGLARVILKGQDLIEEILEGYNLPASETRQIQELAEDDAALARLAINVWQQYRQIPRGPEFAHLVAEQMGADAISPGARQLLYKLACLSLFEIELGRQHVVSGERPALRELRDAGLVSVNSDSFTIGARSVGRLLVQHASLAWANAGALPTPDRVVYNFLQRAGTEQIKATLDMLDRDTLTSSKATYKSLPGAWGTLRFLAGSLAYQVRADPTWQDSVASAAFACIALIEMDRPDAWARSAEFVRSRWSIGSDDELPCWVDEPSADLDAFKRMRERMKEEQQRISIDSQSGICTVEDLDAEKACRMWMLGVLLSFEAKAPDHDPVKLDRLIRIAERQINTGEFYPRHAPWVTAQIVSIQGLQGDCAARHAVAGA